MCGDHAVMTDELIRLQDHELAVFLRRLFASERWQIIRSAHPGVSDLGLLHIMVGWEALRSAVRVEPPIIFCAEEFGGRG